MSSQEGVSAKGLEKLFPSSREKQIGSNEKQPEVQQSTDELQIPFEDLADRSVINKSSLKISAALADLPMQPRPNRVGSSEVNMTASIDLIGSYPANFRDFRAAIAPTTPTVPSYIPARGMASVWDPEAIIPVTQTLQALWRLVEEVKCTQLELQQT